VPKEYAQFTFGNSSTEMIDSLNYHIELKWKNVHFVIGISVASHTHTIPLIVKNGNISNKI
jgi:hypothetical protein